MDRAFLERVRECGTGWICKGAFREPVALVESEGIRGWQWNETGGDEWEGQDGGHQLDGGCHWCFDVSLCWCHGKGWPNFIS